MKDDLQRQIMTKY